MKNYKLSVIVEKDKNGYYAYCPELQGCYSQGDTYEEVINNIRDAIKLHLQDMIENGEEIPQVEMASLTNIEVAV
ncbi:MAG: type II toxin-antitoxin system HicB family antitoxin [Candidatus Aenigmarchaeota archaeon]|nr:type II toxin-antitoxin system HicB family antitoxin [Candidatus Aenigmarchaeota archaeon]